MCIRDRYNIIQDVNFDPTTVKQNQNKWILGELDNLNISVSQALDKFRFNDASAEIYSFTWHLFCDWYIEIIKDDMTQSGKGSIETKQTLIYTYLNLLKICHPFMPFVTEELNSIYTEEQELLVTSNWPSLVTNDTVQSKSVINFLIDTITEIRSIRSELRVVPSNKIKLLVLNDTNDYILSLIHISEPTRPY